MKRIAIIAAGLIASALFAAPAHADTVDVCTMPDLQEQVDCLRALHVEDVAALAARDQTIAQQAEQIAGLQFQVSQERDRANFWMYVAGQEEAVVARKDAEISGLHDHLAYWMTKAYKRAATIERLREKIRELEGQ